MSQSDTIYCTEHSKFHLQTLISVEMPFFVNKKQEIGSRTDCRDFLYLMILLTCVPLIKINCFSFSELQQITDKIDLPLYDFVTGNVSQGGEYGSKLSKTDQLLEEFDSIYDAVELDHLTPPQTPPEQQIFLSSSEDSQQYTQQSIPDNQQQFIFDYQQQSTQPQAEQYIYLQNDVASPNQEIAYVFENSNSSTVSSDEDFQSNEICIDPEPIIRSPADIQLEMEVVDEILSAHSRSQSDYDDDNCTVVSSLYSPRSEYSTSSSSSRDFEPIKKSSSSSSSRGITKKKTRPYGRNPDEKRSRKKEQNKNAATRYRQKKKEEVGVILSAESILMDKHRKLFTSYKDTKREVKYLKSLLRELFQARGFIQWNHFFY